MIKFLILLLCCLNLAAQVHDVRVYIHPDLNQHSTPEVIRRMEVYTDDLNYILAKNTTHRLNFVGVIWSLTEPISQMPIDGFSRRENFDINFSITKTPADRQSSGTPVYFGDDITIQTWFREIYDPNNLPTKQISDDYLLQLHILIHEFGHIFGAAIGEYYSSWLFSDNTGIYPILPPINPYAREDVFWNKRYDFLTDPLLTFPAGGHWGSWTRAQYLDFVQFSRLSAMLINRGLRYPTWSADEASFLTIEVARRGQVLTNARVRLFVDGQIVLDGRTAPNGRISMKNPLAMFKKIGIIKVEHGFDMTADYVSWWDIQFAGMNGLNELVYFVGID